MHLYGTCTNGTAFAIRGFERLRLVAIQSSCAQDPPTDTTRPESAGANMTHAGMAATAAVAACTVVAHAALLFWRLGRVDKAKDDEVPPPYQVLGAPVPAELVQKMQDEAQDIDYTIHEHEHPSLASTASTVLHPYHALLTAPTRGALPGVLLYKRSKNAGPDIDSPTTITTPLFVQTQLADGWNVQERHVEDTLARSIGSNASVTSSLVRGAPSLVGSSIVLSIEDAHKQRVEPTWAPMPPAAKWLDELSPIKKHSCSKRRGTAA